MTELSRRAALTLLLAAGATPAFAEDYPSRPVTILTPFAAGSATDTAARLIGKYLQDSLGQPFIVENRDGAGGMIAAEAVARAAPDGYTILLTSNSTHSAAPALFKTVPYDPIKDFTPIARVGSFPSFIAVTPDLPVKTIQDLVAYAKANPGKINAGYGNSTGRITTETLKRRLNLDITPVAYRSNPAAVTDLMAGHVQMGVPDFSTGLPMLKAEKIRPLAVLTKERDPTLPDADPERDRHARLRPAGLDRHIRPGGHAAKSGRHARQADRSGAGEARGARPLPRRRRRDLLDRSGRVFRLRENRTGEMDHADQVGRHRAGMTAADNYCS